MTTPQLQTLVIAFDGIEEIEALTPVDLLRRAGIQVTIASLNGEASVTGRNQITFQVDTSLESAKAKSYDLIILPGGPGVLELLEHQGLKALFTQQISNGKRIAAICAAPKVLANLGFLENHRATSHISVRSDLPQASNERVVVDQLITSSQGLGTAIEFSLELIKQLRGEDVAKEVAESTHFTF